MCLQYYGQGFHYQTDGWLSSKWVNIYCTHWRNPNFDQAIVSVATPCSTYAAAKCRQHPSWSSFVGCSWKSALDNWHQQPKASVVFARECNLGAIWTENQKNSGCMGTHTRSHDPLMCCREEFAHCSFIPFLSRFQSMLLYIITLRITLASVHHSLPSPCFLPGSYKTSYLAYVSNLSIGQCMW